MLLPASVETSFAAFMPLMVVVVAGLHAPIFQTSSARPGPFGLVYFQTWPGPWAAQPMQSSSTGAKIG